MQANELFTQPNTILLDGGMGTMLQAAGLKLGACLLYTSDAADE